MKPRDADIADIADRVVDILLSRILDFCLSLCASAFVLFAFLVLVAFALETVAK